ncbi:hypothetical protein PV706_45625 [Streptomyces europaeiscabiei]|nr:hypothetical protein [Streptomyces europaeiscabiei]MDX2531466.1 hypothetical protein [Streptomyces europaeiscabiei]MDX3673413.1 hypothetical protein [Streptomyces europaeiscabiei]MDX3868000.1 hypothetical protein [Streptomyces europaeiscabiei]MDX3876749.1 hypothetical protein [Streptomyces europaeiscabiei]
MAGATGASEAHRAFTSISMFIRGSAKPHTSIEAAGPVALRGRARATRPFLSGLAVRAVCWQLEEYLRRAGLASRFGQALTRARRFTTATETPARNAPSCQGLPVAARRGLQMVTGTRQLDTALLVARQQMARG